MRNGAAVLLISNNFPPVRGGSGAVYASLARCAPERIIVLAPRIGYADGLPLIGWREYDRQAPFCVTRLALLRTVMGARQGAAQKVLFVARDILLRIHVAVSVLGMLARIRPRAVCIGELLASGWLLQLLRHIPGLRTLVYVHGEEITTDDQYDPGGVRRRRALLAADQIIVVSRFTQRTVRDLLGEPGRIVLIENGVDTTRFHPAPRNPELVGRYRLEGRFVFVTVCRLLEKKGVDQALRAFAGLLRLHPDTRYLIVGSGPFEPELRALAEGLGVTHAVAFAGNVAEQELVDHYRLGDVFMMPNRALANGDTEGFGLVFLEANGCGLPVIAGRDGGSTDAVRDDDNGLLVDGHSVPQIQAAMVRLREDAALRARLGQRGLAAAKAADWSSRAQAFLRVCLEGKGPPEHSVPAHSRVD
jgi:phosphatidylinositol alpha-1,6-mannosyltransferase